MADLPREFLDAPAAEKAKQILEMVKKVGRAHYVGQYFAYLNAPANAAVRAQVVARLQDPSFYRDNRATSSELAVLGIQLTGLKIPEAVARDAVVRDLINNRTFLTHPERPDTLFRPIASRPGYIEPIPPTLSEELVTQLRSRLARATPDEYDRVIKSFATDARAGGWLASANVTELRQKIQDRARVIEARTRAADQAVTEFTSDANIRKIFPGSEHLSPEERARLVDQVRRASRERLSELNIDTQDPRAPAEVFKTQLEDRTFIKRQRDQFIGSLPGVAQMTNRDFLLHKMLSNGDPSSAVFKSAAALLSSGNAPLLNARHNPAEWEFTGGAFTYRSDTYRRETTEQFIDRELPNLRGYQHLNDEQRGWLRSSALEAGITHLAGIGNTLDTNFLDQQRQALLARIRGQSTTTNRDFMLAQMLEHPAGSDQHKAAEAILKANDAAILGRTYSDKDWNLAGSTYSFTGSQLSPALAASLSTFAARSTDGAFPDLQKDAAELGRTIQGLDAIQLKALQDTLARTTLGPVHAEYLRRQLESLTLSGDAAIARRAMVENLTTRIAQTALMYDTIRGHADELRNNNAKPQEIIAALQQWHDEAYNGLPDSPAERQALLTSVMDRFSPETLLAIARSTDGTTQDWVKQRAAQLLFSGTDARRSGGLSALASDETLRAALPQFNYLPADIQASLRETLREAAGKADLSTPAGIQSFLATQTAERLAQAQDLLKAGTSIHHHLARIALDDKHPEHQAAIRALGGAQGQPGLSAEVLKKPFVEGELKAEGGTFVYTDPTKKPDLVTPLLADINAYARMPLDNGFVQMQAQSDEIAKRIAQLSPAEQAELNRRIADSQLRNSPVHAAYLNYFTGEAFKDKKPAETAALLETLKAMKGPTLTALSTSAAAVGELKSTSEIIAAIEKWQIGKDHTGAALAEYGKVDTTLRPHLVAAAMDDLNTGRLMAIQAQIKADQAKLAAGTVLPASRQEMLTRIEDLLKSHTRTDEVAAIKKFQTDLAAAIPGYNYLPPERQQAIMDKALLEAGSVVADPKKGIAGLPAILDAQRTAAIEAIKIAPITTNRDFLINQMVTQEKDSPAYAAAEAALNPQGGLDKAVLDAPYVPANLPLANGRYQHTVPANPTLSPAAQLIQDMNEFGKRPVALGSAALSAEATALLQRAAALSPDERRLFNQRLRELSVSPAHAAFLKAAIPNDVPGDTGWHWQKNIFNDRFNALSAEGFAALAEKARTLGATPGVLATDLIAGATSWLKPDGGFLNSGIKATTLIPEGPHRAHVLAGALDRLSTAQLAAIQQRLQSEKREGTLSQEKQAVLDSAAALLASDARKEKAAQIQAHINELHATPGFNHLTAEQQRIATDHAMRAVSDRLTGSQPLDAGFLAQQRQTVAALLEKGTGPTLTNREFLVRQMMTLDANTAEYKAAEAALKKEGGLGDAILNSTNPDAMRRTGDRYEGVATSTVAQIGQSLTEFSALSSTESFADIQSRAQTIGTLFRDNPSRIQALVTTPMFTAHIASLSPIHAAYLEQSLRALPNWDKPADNTPQANVLSALQARMGPGFSALMVDARRVGTDHTTSREQLIEIFKKWSQGKDSTGADLPAIDPALKDLMLRAAIDQLNVGQFARITGQNTLLGDEVGGYHISSTIGNLLGDAYKARVEGLVAIQELTKSPELAFSGFSTLSEEQQARFKEILIAKASEHLATPGATLDAAFTGSLAAIRQEIAAAAAEKAVTAETLNTIPGFIHLSADQQGEILKEARRAATAHLAGGAERTANAAFFASDAATQALRTRVATEAATALTQDARVMAGHFPGLAHLGAGQPAFLERVQADIRKQLLEGKPIDNDFWARMRSLQAERLEGKQVGDIPAIKPTVREFLAAQMMRHPATSDEFKAAERALKADGGLGAGVLDKPYVAAQLRLEQRDGVPVYSATTIRDPKDRGKVFGELAESLGLVSSDERRVITSDYNTNFFNKVVAQLDIGALPSLAALRREMEALPVGTEIKTWLPEKLKALEGIQAHLRGDTPLDRRIGDAITSIASARGNEFGNFLANHLTRTSAARDITVAGPPRRTISIRDVVGHQQGADWLLKSHLGLPGADHTLNDLAPLYERGTQTLAGYLLPGQSLAHIATITRTAMEKVTAFATDPKATASIAAMGTLATLEQLESIERMKLGGAPYAEAVRRLEAEVRSMPEYDRLIGLTAEARREEMKKLKAAVVAGGEAAITAMHTAGVIDPAQQAAYTALMTQLKQRGLLSAEQNVLRTELLKHDQTKGLALVSNPEHSGVLHEALRSLSPTATIADAAEALAQHAATDPTLQTKMGFLQARQAAIAAAILKAGGTPTTEQTAERNQLALDIERLQKSPDAAKAPLKFARGADGLPVIDPVTVQAAADKAVGELPGIAAYGEGTDVRKAIAGLPPLTGPFTSLQAMQDAIAARVKAARDAALGALKPGESARDFLTHAMLSADTTTEAGRAALAAAQAAYKKLETDAGNPAALAALPNIFSLNDGKVAINPKLAADLLKKEGVTIPEGLKPLLTEAAARAIPDHFKAAGLKASFVESLPPTILSHIAPDGRMPATLTPHLGADVSTEEARKAALKAAYAAARPATPRTLMDHVTTAMLNAKTTLLEKPDDAAALATIRSGTALITGSSPLVLNDPAHAARFTLNGSTGEIVLAAPAAPTLARTAAEEEAWKRATEQYRSEFRATALPSIAAGYGTPGADATVLATASRDYTGTLLKLIGDLNNNRRADDPVQLAKLYAITNEVLKGLSAATDPVSQALAAELRKSQEMFKPYIKADGTLDMARMEADRVYLRTRESARAGIAISNGIITGLRGGTGLDDPSLPGFKATRDGRIDGHEAAAILIKAMREARGTDADKPGLASGDDKDVVDHGLSAQLKVDKQKAEREAAAPARS